MQHLFGVHERVSESLTLEKEHTPKEILEYGRVFKYPYVSACEITQTCDYNNRLYNVKLFRMIDSVFFSICPFHEELLKNLLQVLTLHFSNNLTLLQQSTL